MQGFEFCCPTKIVCGAHALDKLPDEVADRGMKHPLVMTDAGLVKLGVAAKLTGVLDAADVPYEVFDQVPPDSSMDVVNEVARLYAERGCDGFVAIGGGSVIDTTKGAAASLACEGVDFATLQGSEILKADLPPFIAVPTTAGTGSEVTLVAVVADTHKHAKLSFTSYKLVPHVAILDPALTSSLPPKLTATTGMDALTHAIEAYISWTYNTKESLRLAEEAVKLIFDNLELAYQHGEDLKVRENMMIAAFKAGFAFSRAGVGNVHAIAHTLGGLYNTPHGLANAVILPIVLEDYGEAVYPKLARLCEIAGVKADGTDAEKAQAFIAEIYAMNERMGIPKGFDFIQEEDIPQIITWALAEANPNYPVPVVYNAARCRKVIDTIRAKAAENPPAEA